MFWLINIIGFTTKNVWENAILDVKILISGCHSLDNGIDYSGTANKTIDGISCQRWSSQIPHSHNLTDPHGFVDDTIEEAGSFCRNPTTWGIGSWPWCYTMDPATRWDYCHREGYCSKFCSKCIYVLKYVCAVSKLWYRFNPGFYQRRALYHDTYNT